MPILKDRLRFICVANPSYEADMFYQFSKFLSTSQCPTILNLMSDNSFYTSFNLDEVFI